jgi:hypothetical protein
MLFISTLSGGITRTRRPSSLAMKVPAYKQVPTGE